MSDFKYMTERLKSQERATKGHIAMELRHILAQHDFSNYDPNIFKTDIAAFTDKLNRESYAG